MNAILDAAEGVMKHATAVTIDQEKLRAFAELYQPTHSKHWLRDAPFDLASLSPEDSANFLLLFYSLIFCFWGEPKWTIEYQGKKYDGSYGLLVALRRAYEEGKPIFDWSYWQHISHEAFAAILAGNVEIPLFAERLAIVHEIGIVTNDRYQGQAANLIKACGKDARKLLALLSDYYPSFRDISTYNGLSVPFYKRAQLFVIDIFHFFEGQGLGELHHTDSITALADYKVPQILRHLGIITYASDLAQKVDTKIELAYNSPPEVEIRAANVWAIELVRRSIAVRIPDVTTTAINDALWLQSQATKDMRPYHRCKNIYY
jgi:hypothetical protein